ncbi:MAG: hypothetical protein COX42_01195 [Parcubacteria group bacterium CG23_combo_of_CG06-09_8_20_14_all_35_6]|nr:MAG: hypothetical protein COX42_01195 [Parcubacteria group bacterium CG23_combo_of_CG06-09_8_20_14_all_35_6]
MLPLQFRSSRIFRGAPIYCEQIEGVTYGINPLDFLSLNFPPLCNYRCNFCLASGTIDDPTARLNKIKQDSLTPNEYTRIIQEAKGLGTRIIEISGEGEPTLPVFRSRFYHIINQATKNNIHTVIYTNGFWLDKNLLNFLKSRNTSLVLSVKYMNMKKYNETVGVNNAWKKVKKNIIMACHILGGYTEENKIKVYRLAISSTILNDNYDDNLQLRQFCKKQKILFHLSTLIPHGKEEKTTVDFAKQNFLSRKLSFSSIIMANSSVGKIGFPACGTFYYGLGINYDGQVLFDAHADDTRGIIGNIKKIGLIEALRRQRRMRDFFYKKGGSSYCPLRDPLYEKFVNNYKKEGDETCINCFAVSRRKTSSV